MHVFVVHFFDVVPYVFLSGFLVVFEAVANEFFSSSLTKMKFTSHLITET